MNPREKSKRINFLKVMEGPQCLFGSLRTSLLTSLLWRKQFEVAIKDRESNLSTVHEVVRHLKNRLF